MPRILSMEEFETLKQKENEKQRKPKVYSHEEFEILKAAEQNQKQKYIDPPAIWAAEALKLAGKAISSVPYVSTILNTIEKYEAAPRRAAIHELQTHDKGFTDAAKAWWNQVGGDPSKAPTSEDIGARMGFSREPVKPFGEEKYYAPENRTSFKPASLAGGAVSIATDPLNLVGLKSAPLVGAGAAKAGEIKAAAIQKAAAKISPIAKDIAEERAIAAVGGGHNITHRRKITDTTLHAPGDMRKIEKIESKYARDILDEKGVLQSFDKPLDTAYRLAEAKDKYGAIIGNIADDIDKIAPKSVSATNIADNIRKYANSLPKVGEGPEIAQELYKQAQRFENIGELGFREAQDYKGMFEHAPSSENKLIKNKTATSRIKDIIKKEMEDTVENLIKDPRTIDMVESSRKSTPQELKLGHDPERMIHAPLFESAQDYKFNKGKYGTFKKAQAAATDRAQKNKELRKFIGSPSDYYSSGIASLLSTGAGVPFPFNVATGVGAGLLHRYVRERGASAVATRADKIYKATKVAADKADLQKILNQSSPPKKGPRGSAKKGNPKLDEAKEGLEAMKRRKGDK